MKSNKLETIDSKAKPIPGFPKYFASKDGTIWSKHRVPNVGSGLARRMSPQRVQGGYLALRLIREDGTTFGINIHRLVLLAWLGAPPKGKPYGCHKDGDNKNCHLGNLRWDNAAGNAEDARQHGTMSVGSSHPISKLTDQQVLEIRSKYGDGETLRALAAIYRIRFTTIWHIVNRKTWKHI